MRKMRKMRKGHKETARGGGVSVRCAPGLKKVNEFETGQTL